MYDSRITYAEGATEGAIKVGNWLQLVGITLVLAYTVCSGIKPTEGAIEAGNWLQLVRITSISM